MKLYGPKLRKARKFLEAEKYLEAIRMYETILEKNPEEKEALLGIAASYILEQSLSQNIDSKQIRVAQDYLLRAQEIKGKNRYEGDLLIYVSISAQLILEADIKARGFDSSIEDRIAQIRETARRAVTLNPALDKLKGSIEKTLLDLEKELVRYH